MCGIFGYCGEVIKSKSQFFSLLTNLAIESEVRGKDSTGFAARYGSNSIIYDKMPTRASIFVKTSPRFNAISQNPPKTFIGHTRLGTNSSNLINANNHPFIGDRFIMVHNGVIPSWRYIKSELKLTLDSETDSEIILRVIEKKHTPEERLSTAVEWTLNNINGNMAVALLDKNNPNIWLFRNDNPIWVTIIPIDFFGTIIYFFSSTKSIFDNAWKKTYNKEIASNIHSQILDSNSLFLASTKSVKIKDGTLHRFIRFTLNVSNKYDNSTQYSNHISSHYSYVRNEFYSDIINPGDASSECIFSADNISKLAVLPANTKGLLLDGMSRRDYFLMKALMARVIRLEKE